MRVFGVTIGRRSLRGRVSRVAIVRSGEVSVTVRFGLDELEAAKKMLPGTLLEVVEVPEKKAPPRKRKIKNEPGVLGDSKASAPEKPRLPMGEPGNTGGTGNG